MPASADRPGGMTAAEDEAATADDDSAGEAVDEARLDESWSKAALSAGYGWRSAHWQSS
jgi:hypothetical protein